MVQKKIKSPIQRVALFFVSLALMFSLIEPGFYVAVAESNASKRFNTDFKIAPLESEKADEIYDLSQESMAASVHIDNPKGHKYEDKHKRTQNMTTYVNNDGTKTVEYSVKQKYYRLGSEWKEIDNSIKFNGEIEIDRDLWETLTNQKAKKTAPTSFSTKTGEATIELKNAVDGIGISLNNKTYKMLPMKASSTTPMLVDNNSVLYKNVWKNVDLEYTPKSELLKENIIVHICLTNLMNRCR